jgi:biotin transport system substrate-specific component
MNKSSVIQTGVLSQQKAITQALWIVGFAVATAVGAQFEIQHQPVPYTLQTLFVLLAGAVLGKRNGAISQVAYLLAGVIGVPVFAGFGFGLVKIIGPTGGYLLSFPIAAFVVGYLLEQRKSFIWTLISMFIGLFIIFSLGTLHLNLIYFHNWSDSIAGGFFIFSWWDGLKLFAAASIAYRLRK